MTTQAKMNPEIKQRWVEALRSGEYEQGYEVMHDRNGCFCVLGVLADIAVKDGMDSWQEADHAYTCASSGTAAFFPHRLAEWSGLSQVPWPNPDDRVETMLMRMNDTEKRSFSQLADYIEENL